MNSTKAICHGKYSSAPLEALQIEPRAFGVRGQYSITETHSAFMIFLNCIYLLYEPYQKR